MTDVGEIVVRIKADVAQLEREMKRANAVVQQNAAGMSSSLTALQGQFAGLSAAVGVAAVVAFGKQAFAAADHVNDLAQRTGFLGSTLSALDTPLKQGGSNLDEFAASINRMNAMVGEAAKGTNQDAVKAFDSLGLSVKKLQALSPEQQFYQIAAALGRVGSQAELTEKGMNIFGRSFATLIPIIKDSKGDVAALADEAKRLGHALTDDDLKRIDELGDRWTAALEKMRRRILDVVPLLEKLAAVPDYVQAAFVDIPLQAGSIVGTKLRGTPSPVSDTRPGSVNVATFVGREKYGPAFQPASAQGDNKALLGMKAAEEQAKRYAEARKTLDEYNRSLERQNTILGQTPREQAALEAGYKTQDLARKAGIRDASEQIAANQQLARTNYDLAESMQEAARFQQILHDKLSSTLSDIAFKAGSASEAFRGLAEAIAKAAFEKKIAGPISDALVGKGGGDGLLDGVFGFAGKQLGGFFADGGSPPVGVPSVVGERGPEIFVPQTAGTIVPNTKIGGSTVVVNQSFNLNPGATEQTVAALYGLKASIKAETMAGVFQAIQQGGGASKIVGARG